MATTAAVLLPHATTPSGAVDTITVEVSRSVVALRFRYRLDGMLEGIRVPPPAPPAIVIGLWEHTCFEAFVAVDDEPAYRELNFSPSGAWALHEFRAYRDGAPSTDATLTAAITTSTAPRRLELAATVPLARWPRGYRDRPLRLGLSAVVEDTDGGRSFWALRHAASRPDFHDPEARTLRLLPPEAA